MEKKLMRVTYKLSRLGGIGTVGRAQVLINKDVGSYILTNIRRHVQSVLATLGNVRYAEKFDKVGWKADELLDIVVKMINEVEPASYKIVHLEVKIKDLDFYDYSELLQ